MRKTIKLISAFCLIELETPITLKRLKIRKSIFRTTNDENFCLFLDINELGMDRDNIFMDGINKISYVKCLFIPNGKNQVIVYNNDVVDDWDVKIFSDTPYSYNYLKITVKNEKNIFESSITQENPFIFEIEYE